MATLYPLNQHNQAQWRDLKKKKKKTFKNKLNNLSKSSHQKKIVEKIYWKLHNSIYFLWLLLLPLALQALNNVSSSSNMYLCSLFCQLHSRIRLIRSKLVKPTFSVDECCICIDLHNKKFKNKLQIRYEKIIAKKGIKKYI